MIEIKCPSTPEFIAACVAYLNSLAGVPLAPHNTLPDAAHITCGVDAAPPVAYTLPPGAQVGAVTTLGDPTTLPPAFVDPATAFPPMPASGFGANPPSADFGEAEPQVTANVHPAVDGRGFPWDARIHASSKALLAKPPHGWKPLRGVSPALVQQVEAELIQSGRVATPTAAAPTPPPPAPAPSAPPAPAGPPAPAPSAPPAPAGPPATFAELMQRLGTANKVAEAQAFLGTLGVASFPELIQHPTKWADLAAMVGV